MSDLSIKEAISKAKWLEKKGDSVRAKALYEAVLAADPRNKFAKKALKKLATMTDSHPSDEILNDLVQLYNSRQFQIIEEKLEHLYPLYPKSSSLLNIGGAVALAQNKLTEAQGAFERAVSFDPGFSVGYYNLGNVYRDRGLIDEAVKNYEKAINLNPNYIDAFNNLGSVFEARGTTQDAVKCFKKVLELDPDYIQGHLNLGNIYLENSDFSRSENHFRKALSINANCAEAHNGLGVVLTNEGELEQALRFFRSALEIAPGFFDAQNYISIILAELGQYDAAIESFKKAMKLNPDHAEPLKYLGFLSCECGEFQAAVGYYEKLIVQLPNYAEAYHNLGTAFVNLGDLETAEINYRKAIDIKPDYTEAYRNLGALLKRKGQASEALLFYKKAIEQDPDSAELYNALGVILNELGQLDSAEDNYRKAIALRPDYAEVYNNLGVVLTDKGRIEEAVSCYQEAVGLKPDYANAIAQMFHQKLHMCDWGDFPFDVSSFLGRVHEDYISPFVMLSLEDDPSHQKSYSVNWERNKYKIDPRPLPKQLNYDEGKIRVGYFSSDFHDHATLQLMSGLFREHDYSKFEIYVFSYGVDSACGLRRKLIEEVDCFIDVSRLSDNEVFRLARKYELHIAIDLKGYTQNTRSQIFKYRMAPLQVNYLGYPGTMGASFIDYMIADKIVIPEKYRESYTENIIYMPDSYQPNDQLRKKVFGRKARSDYGLPEDGIVLCCFNNSYKISPSEFDIWMRLLRQIDNSVLWLLRSNRWVEGNLRKEASARNVDPDRIIFADRVDQDEHLERYGYADMFIDTFNVNAHTTASEALWMDLPVVTKQGKQFAARVASSLLKAVGLDELIAYSEQEYEDKIKYLLQSRESLNLIKNRLKENGSRCALFDSKRYTRHFEQALQQIFKRYLSGDLPGDIEIL